MSGNTLTRDEARERARLLRVRSYDVALDVTDGATDAAGEETFHSETVIRFGCRERGASSFLEFAADRVHEVVLNGTSLPVAEVVEGERVSLRGLATDNEVRVVADCRYSRTGEGLHRFADPVDDAVYLYSQFETYDAHRMYACFDQPDLKATFALRVHAPAGWVCVSNGRVQRRPDEGTAGEWVFAATPAVSTYITALVAGPYAAAHDTHDGIGLGLYCRASLAEHLDPDDLFTLTKQGFDFYRREFDYPYPFDKYDQLFVPEFNAGAMENAGCVTILEDYVFRSHVTDAAYERRAETMLHEMAHMWFGDLVTMRWWDDLWLNESFATYVSVVAMVEATRYTRAWTTFTNVEKTWAYRQDQLPSTHPIAADIVDIAAVQVNFDGITYAKGAAVLRQLVAWVGRKEFFTGLRSYFRTHAYGNTTLADLLAVLAEASGRDLTAWSREWLRTAGVNTLRPEFAVDDAGRFTSFAVRQEASAEHPTLRSHRVAIGLYDHHEQGLVRRDRVELDVTGEVTEVPTLAGVAQPDLVLVNDDDLTYTKIRLDPRSLATLTGAIGDVVESLPRALCWSAAWDMTRDAELPARDYLRLVLAGIGAEPDIGVVQTLLRQVTSAALLFRVPEEQDAALGAIAAACHEALRATEPGGDHQLAFVRAFATAARGAEQLGFLRSLLSDEAGGPPVPGLRVDAELRWHLVRCLAARGVLGEDDIAAELSRDPTATGERHAAAARAARPQAAAKAEAWRAVVETDELPNAVQSATIAGFWQADQTELLAPYLPRYLDAVKGIWAYRSSEMAQNIVTGLYPTLLVSPDTVRSTDDYLAGHPDLAPSLRRLLVEGRDDVQRALRARARDAAAGG